MASQQYDIYDEILDNVRNALPTFNPYLLKQYRRDQIAACLDYMDMTYKEAVKLYDGELEFKGHRILRPEERVKLSLDNTKFQSSVDITQTELMVAEFLFVYQGQKFTTQLCLPYLYNDAIIISGSKYYIQFALTDKVFYHISKDNGIGIKVLRSHLRFWRNMRYHFSSLHGVRYTDYVIVAKIHLKNYSYLAEDLRTSIVLYPLARFGWYHTLERYGIDSRKVTIVNDVNMEDDENEYFVIRERSNSSDQSGLFMKIHKSLLEENSEATNKNNIRILANIHYCLQYFTKVNETMFVNNNELPDLLMNDTTNNVWKVILGKTIYGINYASEIQVCGHAEQHLDSLKTYLDPHTKQKLHEIGVDCNDIYDLIDYVVLNMDNYVVNYTPANLFKKRINVLDLLLGNIVRGIFTKVYKQTNNRKGNKGLISLKDVSSLLRSGYKAIAQLYKCNSVAASNPAQYHDNYALVVGFRKTRATYSSSSEVNGGMGSENKAKGKQSNLINNPAHRYHHSNSCVESMYCISHQNPSISGTINGFCPITELGDIVQEPYMSDLDEIIPYLITK